MHISKINITDFYKSSLIYGFPIIMCLISRKADMPEVDNELKELWNSFNSITGEKILFVFGNRSNTSQDVIREINGIPVKYQLPEILSCIENEENSKKIQHQLTMDFYKANPWTTRENVYLGHELQINELIGFFDLKEEDVPCLHISFLAHGLEYIVDLSTDEESLYYKVKKILEALEYIEYENKLNILKKELHNFKNIKEKLNILLNNKYYKAYLFIRNFKDTNPLSVNCSNSLEGVLKTSSDICSSEKTVQDNIRKLKKVLDKGNYKELQSYITTLYNGKFRSLGQSFNFNVHHSDILKYKDKLNKEKRLISSILRKEKKDIVSSLDKNLGQSKRLDSSLMKKISKYLEIKPNFMGVGVNFNEILKLI